MNAQVLHVNLILHVDVIGRTLRGTTQSAENAQPLGVQSIAASRELRASDRDVVELVVVGLAAHRHYRVAHEAAIQTSHTQYNSPSPPYSISPLLER